MIWSDATGKDVPASTSCASIPRRHDGLKRVQVRFELEGSAPDRANGFCDDDLDCIDEIAFGCISEIESLPDSTWKREALNELDDQPISERRSYYR